MKTVITGGAGFIGSHLVDALLAAGDDVTVLDDLSTGRAANIAQHFFDDGFQFVEGSVLDARLVDSLVQNADRVFHLAAAVGVKLIVEHPLAGLRTNIHGTENVLDACTKHGVRLLLASTSEIYGKNESDRLGEESDRILGSALKSRWSYAAAKGIDEAFAHAYFTEFGLKVSIVRLFNTVGARQTGRYGMVVPNLVGQALAGEALTVFGDGTQTRCFSYVGDIVPALVRLSETDASLGEAVNLGGAHEISILDLAGRAIEITGSPSSIVFVPYADAYAPGYEDMRRRVPDNSKAERLIGFVPRTGIDEILQRVADGLRGSPHLGDELMMRSKPAARGRVQVMI